MTRFRLLLACIFLFCTCKVTAQTPNYYLLKTETGTYSELTNDTIVTGAYANPTGTWLPELAGEQITLFDKTYMIDNMKTYVEFSNNGFMRVTDDTSFIVVDAMFTSVDSIDNTTALSYVVEGNPGNKILKVQWKNLALSSGQPGNYVNYQIWLHQSTGIFEIFYGPSSANNSSGYTTTNGPNIGMFYAPQSFAKMYEKIWVNGAPGSYTIDSARTVSFKAVSGIPPNGTVLRYVPKKVAANISILNVADIKVFPNPADEHINIELKQRLSGPSIVVLSDMSGRIVKEHTIDNDTKLLSIPLQDVANGIYQLIIKASGVETIRKINIEHK